MILVNVIGNKVKEVRLSEKCKYLSDYSLCFRAEKITRNARFLLSMKTMLIGYVRQENVVQRPDAFQMGDTDTFSHLPEEHRRLKYSDTFYGVDGSVSPYPFF